MMLVEVAMRFPWVRMTPLGTPVDPDVYMIIAGVSAVGGVDTTFELAPSFTTDLKGMMLTPSL